MRRINNMGFLFYLCTGVRSNSEVLLSNHGPLASRTHLDGYITKYTFSGVTSLNLCLPNCTWAGDMQIELYPFDAGTDDGIAYMVKLYSFLLQSVFRFLSCSSSSYIVLFHSLQSRNMKSEPPQRIHRMTNTFPNNPASPFYGQGPIPPLAVLTLRRIHPKAGSAHNVCTGNETIESSDINEGVTGQLDLNAGADGLTDMDRHKFLMMQGRVMLC